MRFYYLVSFWRNTEDLIGDVLLGMLYMDVPVVPKQQGRGYISSVRT